MTHKTEKANGLLDNPEQDKKAHESARMNRRQEYTDQEIEELFNQEPLTPIKRGK